MATPLNPDFLKKSGFWFLRGGDKQSLQVIYYSA